MTETGWSLDATGVQPGELLLIIGNLDNGWELVYGDPIDTGWTTIGQKFIQPDGQTLIVASKVAGAAEPQAYAGTYSLNDAIDHRTTGASAMALVAVTGADTSVGIESAFVTDAAEATTIIRGTPPASRRQRPTAWCCS